jgi:hypothetical protein
MIVSGHQRKSGYEQKGSMCRTRRQHSGDLLKDQSWILQMLEHHVRRDDVERTGAKGKIARVRDCLIFTPPFLIRAC